MGKIIFNWYVIKPATNKYFFCYDILCQVADDARQWSQWTPVAQDLGKIVKHVVCSASGGEQCVSRTPAAALGQVTFGGSGKTSFSHLLPSSKVIMYQ